MARAFFGLSYDVVEAIENYIIDQKLKADDKLPPERELSELFSVNRKTLRNAISQLCNEGILYTVQGKGTFLAPPKYEVPINGPSCLRDALKHTDYQFRFNNIYTKKTVPKDYALLAFGLEEDETIETQLNIIYIEEEPIAYETIYKASESLSDTYKKRVKFSLSQSNEEESMFLGISKKSDVVVERTYEYSGDLLVRSYSTVIVGSRVTFIMKSAEERK